MAKTVYSNEDLAAKVEWEGGVIDALDYGIRAEQIADPQLAALWQKASRQFADLRHTTAQINEAIGLDYTL